MSRSLRRPYRWTVADLMAAGGWMFFLLLGIGIAFSGWLS